MSQPKVNRRDLLKLLAKGAAAATGAAAISTLPNKWVTPIVEFGALPAHAQSSQRGSLQVTIIDNTDRPIQSKPGAPVTNVCSGIISVTVTGPSPSLSQVSYCFTTLPAGTGVYTFTLLQPGSYSVAAAWGTNGYSGFASISPSTPQTIVVSANLQATATFNLYSNP
jgi:hypothetical protein